MNRILHTQPRSTPATLIFRSPPWLVLSVRCVLFFVGGITAVLCTQHWSAMPLFARFLGALIAPTLVGWSVWPRPWRYTTKFIANENGMYFPAYPSFTLSTTKPQAQEAAAIFHPTRDLIFDLALFTHPHSQDYP